MKRNSNDCREDGLYLVGINLSGGKNSDLFLLDVCSSSLMEDTPVVDQRGRILVVKNHEDVAKILNRASSEFSQFKEVPLDIHCCFSFPSAFRFLCCKTERDIERNTLDLIILMIDCLHAIQKKTELCYDAEIDRLFELQDPLTFSTCVGNEIRLRVLPMFVSVTGVFLSSLVFCDAGGKPER